LRVSPDELGDRFGVSVADCEPTYNASPGQNLPVYRDDGDPSVDLLRWGLVPSWSDDDTGGHINARAETVGEKPSFADAYENRRCVVPADGFYEWKDGQPYYVEFERVAGLAGIWGEWIPERRQSGLGEFGDGTETDDEFVVESFAILTAEPNEKVARLHDRMAVILAEDEEESWLNGALDADSFEPRDEPADVRRVSESVNDPSNDDPALVEGL